VKEKGSKWGSQANKKTMYIAPTSTNEPTARDATEPANDNSLS